MLNHSSFSSPRFVVPLVLGCLLLCGSVAGIVALRLLYPAIEEPAAAALPSTTPLPTATPLRPATMPILIPETVTPEIAPTTPFIVTPAGTAAASPTPTPTPIIHIVIEGETLESIASSYQIPIAWIAQANNLSDINTISIGQPLIIPQSDTNLALPSVTNTANYTQTLLGNSTGGRPIEVYSFGNGPGHVVFIGSIHGGYEWNTTILAYEAIDYYNDNPSLIPTTLTLHIIPTANPDGIYWVTGKVGRFTAADIPSADPLAALPGRFNAHNVDLNRNWDCNWAAQALWRDQTVSGGSAPFSEIENQIVRDFVIQPNVLAVIFWHSAANLVAPGQCGDTEHIPSVQLAEVYGQAADYPIQEFAAYEITGDASDWLSAQGIPSIAVELLDHIDTQWLKNRVGIQAVLNYYKDNTTVCRTGNC